VPSSNIPPVNKDPLKIVSIGRLISRKGFDTIVSTIKNSRLDCSYVIIGDGPHSDILETLIGKTNNITIVKNVSDHEKNIILDDADVFVMLPHEDEKDIEGFGIVFMEAISHNCLVVTNKYSGFAELLRNGINGFVVGNNEYDLRDALNFIGCNQKTLEMKIIRDNAKELLAICAPNLVSHNIDEFILFGE
jgi:glycosyltransferase involved in cell wall biosynthesis